MRTLGVTLAAALAAGAATADGLTFSGYVPATGIWNGSKVTVSYTSGDTTFETTASNVVAGADNYVNVTVETPTPVVEGTEVKWAFDQTSAPVSQTVQRVPYALVADAADKIVPTGTTFVAEGRLDVETATVTNRLHVARFWTAPQARVTLRAAKDKMEAGDFTLSGADVSLSLEGNIGRMHLLGTGTVSRISIAGGRLCEAQTNVTAASDGFLEVKLTGIVNYSKDAAYGERPDRDAFCRICTMVAMDLQDAQGTNQLDEVFGPFRRTTGGSSLVYRPWIVPSARLSGTDGTMTSRLMLPVRAGDRFTLGLAYAEYYPDGDRLRPYGGGRFGIIRNPLWVGDGSHAEAEFTFHAFGGEK